jgi:hypothetical protein
VTSNITVRAQVNNLSNERLRMYRDNKPNRIGHYDLRPALSGRRDTQVLIGMGQTWPST